MTLRRYAELKPSRGTVIPASIRAAVLERDRGCVGPQVGMTGNCLGRLELDHVRASHGMGMKSPTEASNLVVLCSLHHLARTVGGRAWRPVLVDYLSQFEDGAA